MIIFIIYLIGCFVSYPCTKYSLMDRPEKVWTVGYRNLALFLSVFSWYTVIANGLIYLADNAFDQDKPANW